MSHLYFEEQVLVQQLERLSPRLRVAFAAACAQRLLPAYIPLAKRTGEEPGELEAVLQQLWQNLIVSEPMNLERAQTSIDRWASMIPHDDEAVWVEEEAAAEDAVVALYYALRCRQDGDPTKSALSGRRAYEYLESLIGDREDIDPSVPGFIEQVVSHPLVQAELARQRRDIDELRGVIDASEEATVIARLRDRARAETIPVFV